MPFVIDQKPTYKWKVVVKINKDGEVSTEIFTAHFKNISQSRFREMVKMVVHLTLQYLVLQQRYNHGI